MLRAATAPSRGGLVTAPIDEHVARNYATFPVTLVRGSGAWVEDDGGRRYLDLFGGYSALNFGHRHPRLVAAAREQLDRLTFTSRAFGNDQLGPFCTELAALCAKEAVLPMNSGAEAVETAIKAARRWGYRSKGVPPDDATIVVFTGNFHGRTTTIIGFSSDSESRRDFGPFTPGFRVVPYGDLHAVEGALDDTTVAVLVEPVQGEAGVVIPPDGFLAGLRRLCDREHVLLVADEIQSGLGRTGRMFACDHEQVVPDLYLLGKSLGAGIVALSAVVGDWDVLGLLEPGSHGSTFGGNPLACAIGSAVLALLRDDGYTERVADLATTLRQGLDELPGARVRAVRPRGLWAGIDLAPDMPPAYDVCKRLLGRGILVKDAHDSTLRLAPPFVVEHNELRWGLAALDEGLEAAFADRDGR